ncbi:MAG: hypothetical protein HQL38_01540 [Alphaproteobacteria bacterium]|nr:hypothetical protein [Alphaproteobacteria bacterium]
MGQVNLKFAEVAIDQQYCEILAMIDALPSLPTPHGFTRHFRVLQQRVREYFATEEGRFSSTIYPNKIAHAQEHMMLCAALDELGALSEQDITAPAAFLKWWFEEHALRLDKQLGFYVGGGV